MLQTEEVDDDYFTPTSTSTLANIFENPTVQETKKDNETLIYSQYIKQDCASEESSNTAPKPNKDLKTCECIVAYALEAFEWVGNEYLRKGKLGFAILKYANTDTYNIVLYDSNKTTVSNLTVHTKNSDQFVMTSSPQSIAYFDNNKKYWSLHGKEEEIAKIVSVLKNTTVKFNNNSPHPSPTAPKETETAKVPVREYIVPEYLNIGHDKESDTDSSVSKRTKASILNRMASMGHSVLPTSRTLHEEKSNDSSSDTDDFLNEAPKIRSKPIKAVTKRNNFEKKGLEISNVIETKQATTTMEYTANPPVLYSFINGQLVPVTNASVTSTSLNNFNSEFNLFMTEQRMNNNELRVNVNRTTDKVDQVLDMIKTIKYSHGDGNTSNSSNFHMEIAQKLLSEYEKKIKNYEQLLTAKSRVETNSLAPELEQPLLNFKKQILELQNIIKEKDIKIHEFNDLTGKQELLSKEIDDLKKTCTSKDEEIIKILKEMDKLKIEQKINFQNKVKDIMNYLYHTLVMNIDDGETYSGENVKKTIATIIKNTTMQYLNEPTTQN